MINLLLAFAIGAALYIGWHIYQAYKTHFAGGTATTTPQALLSFGTESSWFGGLLGNLLGGMLNATVFSWTAPIVAGIANALGSIISAIGEIIRFLAGSAEGRVVLGVAAFAIYSLALVTYYDHKGFTRGYSYVEPAVQTALKKQKAALVCPKRR